MKFTLEKSGVGILIVFLVLARVVNVAASTSQLNVSSNKIISDGVDSDLQSILHFSLQPEEITLVNMRNSFSTTLTQVECYSVNEALSQCTYVAAPTHAQGRLALMHLVIAQGKNSRPRGGVATWELSNTHLCLPSEIFRRRVGVDAEKNSMPSTMYIAPGGSEGVESPLINSIYRNNRQYPGIYIMVSTNGDCVSRIELHAQFE